MIYFGFNITNPFSKRWTNVWNRVYVTPFKNKFIELEVFKDATIISFSLRWTIRESHAGVMIDAGLLGYSINFNLYDSRHWNTKEGRWMRYSEELGEH